MQNKRINWLTGEENKVNVYRKIKNFLIFLLGSDWPFR